MRHNSLFTCLLLAAGVMVSCHQAHTGHHEAEEAHKEKMALASYGPTYEFYCETDPLVAGEEAQVLVHLTRLQDFKPQPRADVSLRLSAGGGTVQAACDSLNRPGMVALGIKPQKAGRGTLTVEVKAPGAQPETAHIPVTVFADHSQAHEALAAEARHGGNTVNFSKQMGWKSHFRTEECRMAPFGAALRVMAQVEPAQGEERDVVAGVAGIVRMGSNPPVEGMAVRAGQALLSVDGSTTADGNLNVRLQEAEAAYQRARSELERKEPLAGEHIVSQSDLQAARAEYATAKAQWESLKRLFGSGRQTVTAPMAGYVAQVSVRNGQYVEAGQTLVSVSSTRWLTLRAQVPQQSWQLLPHIQDANIRVPGCDSLLSLSGLQGSLLSYGRQVSMQEPLVPVLFRVRNNARMLPGSWVEMFVLTHTDGQAITVPVEAIVEEMGLYFVYVQLNPELFEKREVTLGGTDGRRTQVLQGLQAGERVVASGAVLVKLTQASGGVDPHAGHSH